MNTENSTCRDTVECGKTAGQDCNALHRRTISATVEVVANHTFPAALQAAQMRARITRLGWNGSGPWVPSQGDLFADDWAVLPD